jgi:hypothetical protein
VNRTPDGICAQKEVSMFTLFDFLKWIAIIAGGSFGTHYGIAWSGGNIAGGIAGLLVGMAGGLLIGCLPLAAGLFYMHSRLKRTSSEALRKSLRQQYFISHILIEHLMKRGEDVSNEIPLFLDWMRSESNEQRKFGWVALKLVSPQMASKIDRFNPDDATEKCLELVNRIDPESSMTAVEGNAPKNLCRPVPDESIYK